MPYVPEIIDNRKNLLKDTINQLIKYTTKAQIAAGYFYLSGFDLIKENINPNCTIDIVIGNETNRLTAKTVQEGYDQRDSNPVIQNLKSDMVESMYGLSEEQKDRIYGLAEMIKDNRINFRVYTKEKFHSKAYIFDAEFNNGDIKDQYAIIGSSNFSKRGLGYDGIGKSNTELNAVLRQPSAINEVKDWFKDIWDDSEEFSMDILNIIEGNLDFEKLDYSPFDIILKSLYTLLKDDNTFENMDDLILDDLTTFQVFAVERAIKILNKYNGVIIADSVGLGKTYIAKGLLRYFEQQNKNTLIICPASLKSMWSSETKDLEIQHQIVTQESIGKDGIVPELYNNMDAIIIDEAHNFRNDGANRFKELIKVTMGKKVVELTATPVNNSIFDLYNIMTLFIKEDEFKDKYGIPKLKEVFRDYDEDSVNDKLTNILNEVMIRRSRTFIRKKYGKNNQLVVNGRKLKFPKRHLKKINYDLSGVYGDYIFQEIAGKLENLNLPIISEENMSEKQIALTIGLIKTMFLKRLESSIFSFRKSIEKQKKYCELLLKSINEGYLISKKDVMNSIYSDDFQVDENLTKIDIDMYDEDISKLVKAIEDDKDDFDFILQKIEGINSEKDIKLQTLINNLNGKLRGKKVLIFSEFKDTARYIFNNLKNLDIGTVEELDSENSGKNRKERIVARFAPKANSEENIKNEEFIDILITTDVLSEGQNLQDCNIIINYDLTWNPVKIIQREGRIDRITTEYDDIFIYNFMPDDRLEEILKLIKRISLKIKYINETVGNESKILTEDEILIDKVFNETNEKRIKKIKEEDNSSSLIDELEEERDNMISSEEYIYEDFKNLILNNNNNLSRADNLEDGIFSVRNSEKNKGIYMYYKVGSESYWLFFDVTNSKLITNKAQIYSIISSGNYLKTRPIKRKISYDISSILEIGKEYVNEKVQGIIQSQLAVTEISKIQKDIAERIENMFLKVKYRSRITREQRLIRKKLKNPLHKGTLMKLKTLEVEKLTDDQLMEKLDEILEYINLDNNKNTKLRDADVKLICYEIFI